MQRDYIGHLRALIGVTGYSVSQQNLDILRIKYELTDTEADEMRQYCIEHNVVIYDELEKHKNSESSEKPEQIKRRHSRTLTEEEKEYRKLIGKVSTCIVNLGMNRTRNSTKDMIGFCGTYTSSIREGIAKRVQRVFSADQLRFIVAHLPENLEDDEFFSLKDPLEQELCNELSQEMNSLIPRVGARILFRNEGEDYSQEVNDEEELGIEVLGLSVRAYNCLKRAGFHKMTDFEGKQIEDISSCRGMREACLQEIMKKLKEYGVEGF